MTPQGPVAPQDPPSSGGGKGSSSDLAERLQNLEASMARMETRLTALERGRRSAQASDETPKPLAAAVVTEPPPAAPSGGLMGLAGIGFLVLGGAFFIRAITDSGMVPQGVGVGLGLLYAGVWMFRADRAKADSGASLYTLLALAIVYPLLWESTTTFHAIAPHASALILTVAACLLMAVAWRKSLQKVAWTITLASLVLGLSLMFATKAIEAFTAVFLAFGGGTLWLTYGRRWHGLRWPTAFFADWAVVVLTVFITAPADAPEGFRNLSPVATILLSVGLVLLYLGSFVIRILRRERSLNAFEIGQTLAVLVAGFGGAARVAHVLGSGVGPFGIGALVVAMICYGLSFALVEKDLDGGTNFVYFTSLAFIFMLVGSPMVLPQAALPLTYGGLGLLAVGLGIRFGREILVAHSAVFLSAAALISGALGSSLLAFAGSRAPALPPMDFQATLILASLIGAHLFLVTREGHPDRPWYRRLPSFAMGTWAVLGLGAFIVGMCSRLLGPFAADPGNLATLRTAILACTAVTLAGVAKKYPRSEIGWLVHPVLVLTGLKFLLEDLPKGRPLTFFLAFTLYGGALIIAPRILKGNAEKAA